MSSAEFPELLGGRLCLDFVNTVHHRYRKGSRDYLQDYASWLRWAVHARALTTDDAVRIESRASEPRLAERAFDRALTFRSTAYSILRQRVSGSQLDGSLVSDLNELLVMAAPLRILGPTEQGAWSWSWRSAIVDFNRPLYAVALSLADLLATAPSGRVKECPRPDGCGWLFLDETRNSSRRWCSMNHCGTTSKVRRYMQRKIAADELQGS